MLMSLLDAYCRYCAEINQQYTEHLLPCPPNIPIDIIKWIMDLDDKDEYNKYKQLLLTNMEQDGVYLSSLSMESDAFDIDDDDEDEGMELDNLTDEDIMLMIENVF